MMNEFHSVYTLKREKVDGYCSSNHLLSMPIRYRLKAQSSTHPSFLPV